MLGKRFIYLLASVSALSLGATADTSDDVRVRLDLRAAYSETGREWLDGGLSKTRYGSSDATGYDAEIADLSVLWTPTLSANLSAHLHLQAGPDQSVDAGIVEGFLRYRILPIEGWRLSAKAGRFFPPISLEHDGPGWSLRRTLTPSAINSWIGEEVAVVGVEARASKRFGDHIVDFRGSAFGYNDTAGALLAFRGWALHDVKSAFNGKFALPDVGASNPELIEQSSVTEPSRELNDKVGYYGFAKWRYADQTEVSGLVYDNLADPLTLENGQYGWATRFVNIGASHQLTNTIELIGQAMLGETQMGPRVWLNNTRAVDNEFGSVFLMGSWHASDEDIVSGRIERFSVSDRTMQQDFRDESGWSVTTAWRRAFSQHVEVGAELIYLDHDRPIDPLSGDQTGGLQAQWMLRLNF